MRIFSVIIFTSIIFNISDNFGQISPKGSILNVILKKYYKNEKPVYKNRRQLLYFYCDKTNNNEEFLEATKKANLPKDFVNEIKANIKNDNSNQNWATELNEIYANEPSILKQKINDCQNLDSYHALSRKTQLNNQRLLIVSKPIFYSKQEICLVKITFYRNIEHNNGMILLFEKINNNWVIKEELNVWET